MKLVIGTSPLSVELHTAPRGRRPGQRFQPLAMPDNLYRVAARRIITALIAENKALRQRNLIHNVNVNVRPGGPFLGRFFTVLRRLVPKEDQ